MNPLLDNSKWQPKTWIVPVEIKVMVDDPNKYDDEMEGMVAKVLNELRAVCQNFDRSRKQLSVKFLSVVKDVEKFNALVKSIETKEKIAELGDELDKALERKIKKMKEEGKL